MKQISVIFTAAIGLFFSSCNNAVKEDEEKKMEDTVAIAIAPPAAPAFTPFKAMLVNHAVKDFAKFKAVYFAHDSMRSASGISHMVMGRGLADSNMVLVVTKITDVQKAKDFAASPSLKEAMQKSGVTGKPSFAMVDVLRNDDSKIPERDRIMVAHKVKDFDTWLKGYDAEGKETRLANGMIDRGLARGVDDPSMVYVVFAITDMTKAKARINSSELKKIMTDAGVTSPPQFTYYKLVD